MNSGVSDQTLLQGAWYALHQSGRLLASAAAIFDSGDVSTALAVAMFGREELGRSRLLRECAREVAEGKTLDANATKKRCAGHVEKQSASAFSVTLRTSNGGVLGKAMRDQSQHAPTSVERQRAKRTIDAAVESTRKRQPNDRHALRCVSLYVDLEDSGTNWLRPVETTSEVSRNAVEDAIGDYALEFDHLTNESLWPALKVHHPHLHIEAMIRAKAKMSVAVELIPPVWPKLPDA